MEKPLYLTSSPLQEIFVERLKERKVRLFIKRDDLLYSLVSGNKWRKLCYNISAAKEQGKRTLITFGGAYSNHIHAVAAAGQLFGFNTIGLIRGEEPLDWGFTLRYAESVKMNLRFLSRSAYRQKLIPENIDLKDCYFLPEGGTNELAILGCRDIVTESLEQLEGKMPDYWSVSCGTGGTISGLIAELKGQSQILGFSSLKGDFLQKEIVTLQEKYGLSQQDNWKISTDYHFGGYARHQPALIDFIMAFYKETKIPLDPIYTGKMMYGIFDLIDQGFFSENSKIVAVHTGGLQGIAGFNERHGFELPGGGLRILNP